MRLCFLLICSFNFLAGNSQSVYKKGDVVADFKIPVLLNSAQKTSSFNTLKKELTIIDFFGTWCGPCIRALPLLDSIQKKHPAQIEIILVSIEKEAQLNKFIADHKTLAFPIMVDGDNAVSNLFQPPSYPYTVVINNAGQIVDITEASSVTDEKIKEWMAQKNIEPQKVKETSDINMPANTVIKNNEEDKNGVTALSEQFIYAAKSGNETAALQQKLSALTISDIKDSLKRDNDKKAFWINIYNGYTQLLLKQDPDKYKDRSHFFKAKQVPVAGEIFSLDEIEHDILRRSKIKWSLGYLNKIFPGKMMRSLRVKKLDYRIHFALNCGAKSCPPIAFYKPATLDTQLDVAARAYLTGEAIYNTEENTLELPAIMGWFRHDFKGKKNMLKLVKKYDIVPQDKKPHISFKKYNWDLYLDNYRK